MHVSLHPVLHGDTTTQLIGVKLSHSPINIITNDTNNILAVFHLSSPSPLDEKPFQPELQQTGVARAAFPCFLQLSQPPPPYRLHQGTRHARLQVQRSLGELRGC